MNKISYDDICFIMAIPIAVLLILESFHCADIECYSRAIFNFCSGLIILTLWVKEALDRYFNNK